MAFMPHFAPIVVLLFLGSVLASMLGAAVFAYGVARKQPAVRRWAAIGRPPHAVDAAGIFTVVTLKTWFAESTISSSRPTRGTGA